MEAGSRTGQVASKRRDDPGRNAAGVVGTAGAADRDGQLPDLERCGDTQRSHGESVEAVGLDDGQVRQRIQPVGRTLCLPPVLEPDEDLRRPFDNMLVGQDPAALVVDDPGSNHPRAGGLARNYLNHRRAHVVHGVDDGRLVRLDRDRVSPAGRRGGRCRIQRT